MLQIRKNIIAHTVKLVLLFLLYCCALTSIVNTQWRLLEATKGFRIYDIDVYRGNPDTMYALADNYFLRSFDAGTHWDTFPSPKKNILYGQIKIDAFHSKIIYASIEPYVNFDPGANYVMMTKDGGMSWDSLFYSRDWTSCLVEISPSHLNKVFVGVGSGMIKYTTNQGLSWSDLGYIPTLGLSSLAIDPFNDSIMYVGTYSGIYKSYNAGTSWSAISIGAAINWSTVFSIDPINNNNIYLAYWSNGVFKSTDAGFSWSEFNSELTNNDLGLLTIFIHPEKNNEVYIGIYQAAHRLLFKSENAGENWIIKNEGLPEIGGVFSLAFDVNRNLMFAGVNSEDQDSSGVYFFNGISTVNERRNTPNQNEVLFNYPNPFNSSTEISYQISKPSFTSIEVFDITGRRIKVLKNKTENAGNYTVKFVADNLPSGIYFVRLQAKTTDGQQFTATKKMLLTK